MKPLIVFDIDGVLANIEHRAVYLEGDKPDWVKFYSSAEIAKDVPVPSIISVYKHFLVSARVEVWTGRCISTALITRKWLQKHAGLPADTKFRPKDSRLSNLDLKRSFLTASKQKPSLVFDAQPRTSEFWHKRGIQVCYTVHP